MSGKILPLVRVTMPWREAGGAEVIFLRFAAGFAAGLGASLCFDKEGDAGGVEDTGRKVGLLPALGGTSSMDDVRLRDSRCGAGIGTARIAGPLRAILAALVAGRAPQPRQLMDLCCVYRWADVERVWRSDTEKI